MRTGKGRIGANRKTRKMDEAVAAPVIEDEHDKLVKLEKPLLLRIPNDVTLEHITTKLPWSTFSVLRSVSRAWQQGIEDRLIQNVRDRKHSTQTLVIFNHIQSEDAGQLESGKINAIALYSLKDKVFYRLPPIPEIDTGMPWKCQCIALDRKIYILGGTKDVTSYSPLGSKDVYMIDVAGQRQWKRCAQMNAGRLVFGCGAVNGKIYVFGGTSLRQPVPGSEVYDPVVDAWSAIKPKNDMRFNHDVTTVGEELYVYCGEWMYTRSYGLKAYNPLRNTWRVLSRFLWRDRYIFKSRFFMAQGKVYSMSSSYIHVYDLDNKSRTTLHSFSFDAIEQRRATAGLPQFAVRQVNEVLHVDNELLAIVSVEGRIRRGLETVRYIEVLILVKSTGFNRENERIVWEEVFCPLSFEGCAGSPFKGILQL